MSAIAQQLPAVLFNDLAPIWDQFVSGGTNASIDGKHSGGSGSPAWNPLNISVPTFLFITLVKALAEEVLDSTVAFMLRVRRPNLLRRW